eukprot:Transcript_10358.p3 GENE.Transcript_10358~~Transcript_10358.p3  ORF type:complete len:190 (+),score=72.73 Transcript_10358:2069-2638(+)
MHLAGGAAEYSGLYHDAATILSCRDIVASVELGSAALISELGQAENVDFLVPQGDPMLSAYFAAGLMLIPMLHEGVLCRVLRLPGLLPLLEDLLLGATGTGCLQQLDVPAPLHAAQWSVLFEYFLALGAVPLGLFRAPGASNALPYVLTNPPPDTRIEPADKVFAVAMPGEAQPASRVRLPASQKRQEA